MKTEIEQTIRVLCEKIRAREDEVAKLKRVVNDFCADENRPPMFQNIATDSAASIHSIRSDQFYGQTLAGAAKEYLTMRKASGLGAATVLEIYDVLKAGGYKFDTQNEENAKNGLRISLRKNSYIFHKLPNGQYGLREWYGVKEAKDSGDGKNAVKKHAAKPKVTKEATASGHSAETNGESFLAKVEGVLRSDAGKQWNADEIVAKVPELKKGSLATLLNRLSKAGKVENPSRGMWKAKT